VKNEFRVAIYSRKSKFTGKGESTENQIEMCKSFLRVKFPEAYEEDGLNIYEDEGFSGSHINRPQFINMMNAARARKFDTIVCYRLDRISRNISDFAKLIDELTALNIAFISIKEQFDTAQPMGRAMMYIASVFSQLERETIGERIKDNMEELAKDGRWLGGVTPTGYRSIRLFSDKKHKYVLEPVLHELEIVKLIFEVFENTHSLYHTADYLNKKSLTTKNDKPFSPVAVKGILENPVYMRADIDAYNFLSKANLHIYAEKDKFNGKNGIMAYKKTLQKAGKVNQKLDPDRWIISVGQHEGIIEGVRWVQIHNIFTSPTIKNDYALLSGIIVCGLCGSGFATKKRYDKPGFYYTCKSKCGVKNLSGLDGDKEILKKVLPSHYAGSLSLQKKRTEISDFVESVVWDGRQLKIISKGFHYIN